MPKPVALTAWSTTTRRSSLPRRGDWWPLPVDPFVAEAASEFYASMTPSEWEEVFLERDEGLHLRLASRCGFSDSVAEDAMEKVRSVARVGWSAYVEEEMATASRRTVRVLLLTLVLLLFTLLAMTVGLCLVA